MTTVAKAALTHFFDQLSNTSNRILLLDYDGTLAPFRVQRDRALPYPEVAPLIDRIIASGTRVVLISGRAAKEVRHLCGIQHHPEIWGSHGLERLLPDGSYHIEQISSQEEAGIANAAHYLRERGWEQHMEMKAGGVALHWRGLPESQAERMKQNVEQAWRELLLVYPLQLLNFDGGVEVRVQGKDKGKAVGAILGESNPNAVIAYLGDDRTDEDAFRTLKGRGLTVLVRDQFRSTLADIQLRPPQELLQFLRDWLSASGRTPDAN